MVWTYRQAHCVSTVMPQNAAPSVIPVAMVNPMVTPVTVPSVGTIPVKNIKDPRLCPHLRALHSEVKEAAPVTQKRPSAEFPEAKNKKTKIEQFRVKSPFNVLMDRVMQLQKKLEMDTPPDSQTFTGQDSDMRKNCMSHLNAVDVHKSETLLALPPVMQMFDYGSYPPKPLAWRVPRLRNDDFGPIRFRDSDPTYFTEKYDKRGPWPPFDPRLPMPPLPSPKLGMCQRECPLLPYQRTTPPPPLGASMAIPPTDFKVLEYINQDPVKTIQIDGIPREIRFYGETAIIMMDWDDPREIKFLPGCRRITFDNKDSIALSFNEGYKQVVIDDQVFDIRFGAPTRELYINGRWYECFFGGQPIGIIIDGKPRQVHLEGPLPQIDIGKVKRTDLVAGKINVIINTKHMCPVYLDAKVQEFHVNNQYFTIRFVDSLRTVLINEQPFEVEYGGMPKPIYVGNEKYFIRFSALPHGVKPGDATIEDMEGERFENIHDQNARVMPSCYSTDPASASKYKLAEEKPNPIIPVLGNLNVNDLFAKLVASGIVQVPEVKKEEPKPNKVEEKPKPKEERSVIHKVDLLNPETLRVKQPGLISRLYAGTQCSGCDARFPPEQTVRYSQHLDWHFRQNRRDRDSARMGRSRPWHYDKSDWLQYEEVESDLEKTEKSWFETNGQKEAERPAQPTAEAPLSAAGASIHSCCALCGDEFNQFYNEDKEEWHLRNCVRHHDDYFHPLCFDDYKASLTKGQSAKEEVKTETAPVAAAQPRRQDAQGCQRYVSPWKALKEGSTSAGSRPS